MVTITVTAENGATRQYKIWVTRVKNPDDINANLSSIIVSNAELKDEFSKEKTSYILEDISNDVNSLKIETKTEIDGAKVEIIGNENLKIGTNKIIVKVTSKDESISKEYELIVYKSNEVLNLVNMEQPAGKQSLLDKIKSNYILVIVSLVAAVELIIIIAMAISKKARESYNMVVNSNASSSKSSISNEKFEPEKTVTRRNRRDIE